MRINLTNKVHASFKILCSLKFAARLVPSQWYVEGISKYPKLLVFISHKPTWAGCIPAGDNKIDRVIDYLF